jgi:DNA mismatch repair protein MutL
MVGRYSVGFLFLTIPPDKVDVNVHPTKAEVRFQENSLVYSLVRSAVKSRLLKENLVPRLTVPTGQEPGVGSPESGVRSQETEALGLFSAPFPPTFGSQRPAVAPTPVASPRADLAGRTVAPWEFPEGGAPLLPSPLAREGLGVRGETSPGGAAFPSPGGEAPPPSPPRGEGKDNAADAPGSPEPAPPALHAPLTTQSPLPGTALQVQDTYLVLETPEGMLVIDQHALHERILFEQLRRRIRAGQLEVQRLLIPEPIDLPAEQAALVLEAAGELKELGLEVSDFGGNTVLLSSYPTLLGRRSPHDIFRGVVDYLLSKERPPSRDAMLHNLMATMACKAAVKAGDRLSPEEIAHLLHLRQLAEDSHHCPHGRPTSLLFSRSELDKQFRRT